MNNVLLCVGSTESLIPAPLPLGYSVLDNGSEYLILVPHVSVPKMVVFDGECKRLALRLGDGWVCLEDLPVEVMRALAMVPSTVQLAGADIFARPTFCISLAKLADELISPGARYTPFASALVS